MPLLEYGSVYGYTYLKSGPREMSSGTNTADEVLGQHARLSTCSGLAVDSRGVRVGE